MTTKLDKPLKREIEYNGVPYTVTFAPDGIKIVEKGKRKGQEVSWKELIGGSVGLTQDLRDSIQTSSGDDDG